MPTLNQAFARSASCAAQCLTGLILCLSATAHAAVKTQLELAAETPDGIALDAEVTIDGHLQEKKTPGAYSLPPGRHDLIVTYSGRTWSGTVKTQQDKITKKRVILTTYIASSAYSLAFSAGGGIARLFVGNNLPSENYTGLLTASLDGRTKSLPFSLQLRAIYITEQRVTPPDAEQSDFLTSTISVAGLSLAPVFYWAMVRQSDPEGSSFAAPTDREQFFALFLTIGPGVGLSSYSTYLKAQALPITQSATNLQTYVGLGLYGQSNKGWQGRGGLYLWSQNPDASLGSFQVEVISSIMAEFGYVLGLGR